MDQSLETTVKATVAEVQQMQIASQDDYDKAGLVVRNVKGLQKQVRDAFDGIIEKAHAAHKEAIASRDKFLKPLEAAEAGIKKAMGAYFTEQENLRRKLEAEQRAAEEKARKEAEERNAAVADIFDDAPAAEPMKLETVTVEIPKTKTEGVSMIECWTFRITDEKLIPREFLMVAEEKIRAHVDDFKADTKIAGVEVTREYRASVRR